MTREVRQTTRDLRRHNRCALLPHLYLRGPANRLELARESGLNSATVSNVVSGLICDGTVRDAVRRHALAYRYAGTGIELGRLGAEAVALGAATLPVARLLAAGGQVSAR